MNARRVLWPALSLMFVVACVEEGAGPDPRLAPSFAVGGVGRPSVLVNPNSDDNGTAKTIQEGIDMVAEGGTVMVLPGIYPERIVIERGLTLEGIGGQSDDVMIEQVLAAPTTAGDAVIQVATRSAVVLRRVTVHHVGLRGLNAFTAADVTIEQAAFHGEWPTVPRHSRVQQQRQRGEQRVAVRRASAARRTRQPYEHRWHRHFAWR